jgi:hypothetical protein
MKSYLSIVFSKKFAVNEKFTANFLKTSIFGFVIQKAMAIALKIGICDLLTEFLADAFIVLRFLQTAGAVAALSLEAFLDLRDKLGIFI